MKYNHGFSPRAVFKTSKGEVRTQLGCGTIRLTKAKNDMWKVETIDDRIEYPPSGYIPNNDELFPILEKAQNEELSLIVRFEQKFKNDKNPDLNKSIEEFTVDNKTAKENTVKVCTGVFNPSTKEWAYTSLAQVQDLSQEQAEWLNQRFGIEVNRDEFFKEIVEIPKDYETTNQLADLYLYTKEQELKHEFNLSDDERQTTTKSLLRVVGEIQKLMIKSDTVDLEHKSFNDAKNIMKKIHNSILPLNEDLAKDNKLLMKNTFVEAKNLLSWITK